jgi:hypothetical protein
MYISGFTIYEKTSKNDREFIGYKPSPHELGDYPMITNLEYEHIRIRKDERVTLITKYNYKEIKRVKSFHDGSSNKWLKLPKMNEKSPSANPNGRYPSNLLLTHHQECDIVCHDECPIKIMDEQSGKVGASKFFYIAKPSKSEKNKGVESINENSHPTIKPIKIMQYLVKMVTKPNGLVLDPFCGSGTTGIASILEGLNFVGIDKEEEYCDISKLRISEHIKEIEKEELYKSNQIKLFI